MIRPQFSYWLSASPSEGHAAETGSFIKALGENGCLHPDGPLEASWDDERKYVSAEVVPDLGTVEQDDSLKENIAKTVAMFPGWTVEFEEMNEEDKSQQIYTKYRNGKEVLARHARLVDAHEEYDEKTIMDIISLLEEEGHYAASGLIRKKMIREKD